ncbi:MAG: PKD domain-containing protein [Ardenticatenaceae bacterium]|nr:PKD domain-containing protein [Ardenticatenaceae bacterium]MCB8989897.1 PKD domain-containing protein [Ardenticatenaceae bacterium]
MQPGEVRQVAAGTQIAYRLPGGQNYLTLPPLYVTAAGLGELAPAAQDAAVGGTAVFTLTLSNLGSSTAVYTLSLGGIPDEWLDYPSNVPIGADGTETVFITVTVPADADPDTFPLWLDIDNGSGGTESLDAELTLFDALALFLDPTSQSGIIGQPLTYTLTISNLEAITRSYDLTATGLAEVTLPQTVLVAGNSAEMVMLTAVPPYDGPQPFTITAHAASAVASSVDGVATGDGRFDVLPVFTPETAHAGPGATAVYTLTLSNIGDIADSYALTLDAPADWTVELDRNGTPLTEIALPAQVFNSADLLLLVTPDENAQPGSYPITLTVQSLTVAEVVRSAVITAEVTVHGAAVTIAPHEQTVDPLAPATWDIIVTNLGSEADSFDLTVSGVLALVGEMSTTNVSLAPGASQTVQFTADGMDFLLPDVYPLVVQATSQANPAIHALDEAVVTLTAYEAVALAWKPPTQTVTNTFEVTYYLVLSNTGNLLAEYDLSVSVDGGHAQVVPGRINVPANGAALLPVTVQVLEPGEYEVVAVATAVAGSASDTAAAALTVISVLQPLAIDAGPDLTATVIDDVQFSGIVSNLGDNTIDTIVWDFGDGNIATGTLTPTHRYAYPDEYMVTLTVTDSGGNVGSDTLQVTIGGVIRFLPIVIKAP